ncbi:rubisco accumulation factor 1.1, chloroplastic-like [Cucurbita pepo subsp. pepo]|uniref:rubisco accumulation factor 1.1, chloroplastic-like n=1 Tax=Cucurbita pepo subsp. pepo TaxID=3664 RepID=UPI000C9D8104|nr:rubisco accumulation factor 1.1, chloroplastic-like [Cucurbita pepo subsp. pepo]
MLSATAPATSLSAAAAHTTTTTTTFLLHTPPLRLFLRRPPNLISASLNPYPSPSPLVAKPQVYQPFRPPPSPLPSQYRSLDAAGKLDVLANRLGLWFEYAPLISSLIQEGFTPPTIEEITGIGGVQQNTLVVGAQVRESLVQTINDADPDLIAAFDTGGAELLYEIRLLNAEKRAAAARYIVDNRLDGKGAQDLARAMKDFPRRRGDKGWESFNYDYPGDCLAFMHYRLSREYSNMSEARTSALEDALKVAVTEEARSLIVRDLEREGEGKDEAEEEIEAGVKVPVVRLKIGEVAEATTVVVLPVCNGEEGGKGVGEAPMEVRSEGEFGVVVVEEGWRRWVVLPGWEPIAGLGKGGVVVAFKDARALPWRVNRWYKEEAILVVADRSRKEVEAGDGFYLTGATGNDGELKVQRGSELMEMGLKESLGTVLLVVRPPKDMDDDQLSDEDWD